MDLVPENIEIAQKSFENISTLEFLNGNAQQIPLQDSSFDLLLNVESSHGYPDFSKAAHEAFRVLKPGGYFLWADFLIEQSPSDWKTKMQQAGFEIRTMQDISGDVLESRTKAGAELS